MDNFGEAISGLFYAFLLVLAAAFFLALYVIVSWVWQPEDVYDKCMKLEQPELIVQCIEVMKQ